MTELDQLREEIAKLRERVAVLEARPVNTPLYPMPMYPQQSPIPPWTVTCLTDGATATGTGVLSF